MSSQVKQEGEGGQLRNGKDRAGGKKNRGVKRGRSRSPADKASGGGNPSSRALRRVYVANVPFDVKWSELKDLFRDKVGNVVYCQLFEDEQGRSRGCGLVEFQDSDSAKKAIEVLHRHEFRDRELVVKEDLDCERDRYGRLILPGKRREREDDAPVPAGGDGHFRDHQSQVDQRPPPGTWNTYGLSPQFLESLGVTGPLNNRIFVANLEYKVQEKKLEEIFKLAGKVLRVRLTTDSQGQSKGYGTVEFDHPVEAVQAISMFHNQKLYGRPMSIRMDRYENEEVAEVLPTKLPSGLEGIGKGLGIGGQPLNVSKSLLGSGGVGSIGGMVGAPPPIQVPGVGGAVPSANALSSLGGMSSMQSLPVVPTALSTLSSGGPNVVCSSNPLVGQMSALDQRSSVSIGGNSFNNFSTMSSSSQVRNPGVGGMGSQGMTGVSATVYEREFRDSSSGLGMNRGIHAISDTIIVRNLPPSMTWQTLKDEFNKVADVRYAELKGVGTAILRFFGERDAQRAIDTMNGVRLGDRQIEVSFFF